MKLGTSVVTLASVWAAVILAETATAQSRSSVVYTHPVAFTVARFDGNETASDAHTLPNGAPSQIRHGVIGAVSGAIVGGGVGYLYVAMHCDNGNRCEATREILTGAAIGAVLGWIVEYGIRSWPEQVGRQ